MINFWISAIVFVLLLASGSLWFRAARGKVATLEYVSGEVLVTPPDGSVEWRKLSGDIRVRAGQQVRVTQDSVARLVFNDGSRIMLDAGARIRLQDLSRNWLTSLKVVIIQEAGRTRHSVVPLRGPGSGYQVVTSSGTVTAVGTSFTIAIDESGYTRFSVDKGKVMVQGNTASVTVSAGQALVARGGVLEDQAAFQFSLGGALVAGKAGTWSVSGEPFLVDAKTLMKYDLQPGTPVFVEGRILGGQWVADFIRPIPGREDLSSFTGVLSAKEDGTWLVGGREITVSPDIDIVGRPEVGEAVQVVSEVGPGGRWEAGVIIALGETGEVSMALVTPASTLRASDTAFPTSTLTPTSIIFSLPVFEGNASKRNSQLSPASQVNTSWTEPTAAPTIQPSQQPVITPTTHVVPTEPPPATSTAVPPAAISGSL